MRKYFFVLLIAMTFAAVSNSQVSNYTFAASSGTYTPLVAPTNIFTGTWDDNTPVSVPIGFTFNFNGANYTSVFVNANGSISFGATAAGANYTPISGTTAYAGAIAAWGRDIQAQPAAPAGSVDYLSSGGVFTVQWTNARRYDAAVVQTERMNFQIRLIQATNQVVIVYGSWTDAILLGPSGDNATVGGQVGLRGATNADFKNLSVLAAGDWASPTAGAVNTASCYYNSVTPATKPATGQTYTFTPPPPCVAPGTQPTGLSLTPISTFQINGSFTATAADGYLTVRYPAGSATTNPVTGTTYTAGTALGLGTVVSASATTTFNATGLTPGTTYDFYVYAYNNLVCSVAPAYNTTSPLTGSQTTTAAGNITSLGTGLWSVPGTWSTGIVPTATDNVTIADGHTVTIDIAAVAYSVTVGQGSSGILQYEQTTARTLTVGNNVTIAAGGTFQSNAAGTVTTHTLSLAGNLVNNGTLDFSTNANTAAAGITFTGASNNSFGGTGAVTDLRTLIINKGTSNANILELNPSNFTVQGTTTDGTPMAFLTLTNGTLKVSGTFTLTGRVFTAAAYTIGTTAGFWLNNPNFTVAAQVGNAVNNGLFRITQGVFNQGTLASHSFRGGTGALFTIEGGIINCAGQFSPQNAVIYNQSGGTLNVGIVGNSQSNFGTFELFSSTATFTMSGGVINIVQASTGATQIDFQNLAVTTVTGGMLNIGTAATVTKFTYNIRGNIPNITIDNTTNNKSATATSSSLQTFMRGTTLINTGTTLTINGQVFIILGPTFTNNGTLTGTTASTRFYFLGGLGATTYTGSGVVTAPLTSFEVDNIAGVTMTPVNQVVTARFNNFSGGLTGSNKLTIGNGAATTAVVQLGVAGVTQVVSGFDVPPVFNPGSGGVILLYAPELTGRITGNEMPPSRTLTTLGITNTNPITIAGGDVIVNGAGAGALALGAARVITGTNTLYFNSAAGTVTRSTGYVDGNFRKSYTAAGSKTFEVGTANGYSPVDINVTAGTFPTDITAKAVQGTHPNLNAASSLQRYWTLTGSGVTADFTFNYLAADVSGTEANYDVVRIASGVVTGFPASTVNTGTHVATLTGVTSFSDWSLSELCTGAVGGTATGTTAFCGSGTPTITATGYSPSGTGTSYQWEFSNDNFVSDVHDFVGQTDPATLTTGVVSSTTYYRLRVSCSVGPVIDYSNIVTVTINLVPTAFTVTGGGTYCGGAGVPVGLSDSESGVDYQLFLGAAPVGAPVPGTGAAISFGNQTAVGTYTVVATNSTTTCTNNMTGSVNVSTATAPVVTAPTVTQPTIVTPTGTIVVNATGGPTLEYSVTGVGGPYQLSNTFTGLTPGASYNIAVRLQNTTGCETLYSGNPIIMNTTSGRVTDVLVGASPFQDSMWTINLADYTIIRRIGPTLPGFTITGINALATHPLTGEHFAILKLSGVSGRVLAKINVQTGVCTQVGNMGDNFSTLAFRPNGELYSVTGNGSNPLPAETMYSINTTTGAPTFYRTLGNGADGEVIAYNPDDNFFYHWSGNGTVVWEKFANDTDPIQGLTTPVNGEVFGALYAGGGEFWVSNISSTIRLWNVTTQTASAVLMNTPDDLRGLVRESCSSSLAASGSTAICSGGNVVLSVIGGVADYQWYRDGVLIGGETNPTLTVTTAGFYNAIYTDGCGVTDSVTLGISVGLNPTPDALATPSAQTICSAGTITTIVIAGTVPGTTYNWTRDNTGTVTGIAASGSGDISGALTNTTNAPVIVTFTITPTANGCTGTPVTATVTVNPTPTVDAVPNQVVCNNAFTAAVNFTSPVSGTTFNWTNTNTSIGLGASGTGNIASFLATNAGTAPITGTITVTPVFTSTGGPVSVPFNYTGTPQTWTVPAGVTSIRLQAAGAQGGSVSTACTATGGLGASMAGDFAVTPGEVLTIIVGQQGNTNGSDAGGGGGTYIVRAGNVPLLVAGGGGGASNNIGSCGSNLNGINASITTSGTASGDGLIAGGTAGNGGGASGGSGGGGGGFLTDGIAGTGLANNNGKSYLNGSAGGTGNNNDAGGYGGGGAGWFTGGNGGGGGGYSGGGTSGAQPFTGGGGGGSYNDGTNQVNTAAAQTGNGFAMITTFNAPITCTGTPTSFTYTVNPTPVITPVANQTVCNGAGIPPVNFVVSTTGGINSIAWTNSNPAIGIPASGTGNIFGFTATNATNAPISGTITVTPSFSNGSVTCSGTSITYTVTVNPTATVTAVANQTVCNGANTTAVNFTSPTTGGTIVYNWTNNTPSIGLAASGSGNIASFVGTNATNAPVTATITVTPTYTNGVSCVGTASTFTITVNPTATVTAVANQTLCNGASTAAVTFTSPTTGGTIVYNWTNNTPSIGLAASGSGNIASFTAVNAGTAPVVATITVTPTYTNGVSCVGTPRTFTITVNPTPNAIATPASQTICSGATITPIVLTSGVSGTTYAWIRNNTATVTGIAASGTGNITGALTNTTGASITVTFTITPTANGCPGTPITATVVVNTAATIVCPAPITVPSVVGGCTAVVTYTPTITGSPAPTLTYTFTGATTASGSGSGSGAAFNVGVTTVTITATNSCGTASCSFTVTVTDSQLPVISSQPANRTICTGLNATFSVTATNVVTYQWQQWNGTAWVNINGANASTFTLNGVTVSQNTNTYRVVLNGLCTIVNSNAATLFVNPPSTVTIAAAPPSILPNQTTTLTATGVPPGGTYAWTLNGTAVAGVTGAVLGPLNVNQLGTYRVVYTSPAGCISTSNDLTITGAASMELWVYPNPNTGQFQVRFYNMVNEAATVNVYDALGQKVYQRKLVTGNTAYTQIDIDLGFKANGIYIVELVNGSGKRIATKRINVQNK